MSFAVLPVHGRLFRALAIAEACSWAALLIGMPVTYVVVPDPIGRPCRSTAGLDLRTVVLAPAASIPPLCTLWFERWALRTGRLGRVAAGVT